MPKKTYQLEIFSDPNLLPEVEEFLENISLEINLDKSRINNLLLSVNEAISNAMLHGNRSDINKKVRISVDIDEKTLSISIKDEGEGFDPERIPDPTSPENIFKDSGRGLYIMRTCIDDMQYIFHEDGTELVLIINLR
ncbi:MAG: ATP-binding protein [Bacteroidota bacterium]|nr:ATP-binding protein [Bacteroidota bacterium]